MKISYAAISVTNESAGCLVNEDALLFDTQVHQGDVAVTGSVVSRGKTLWAVSDGLHVSPNASNASKALLSLLDRNFEDVSDISPSRRVTQLHEAFSELAVKDRSAFGMSATLVAAEISDCNATVYHVGDSRAWLSDGAEALLLTDDHTVAHAISQEDQTEIYSGELASGYESLNGYFSVDTNFPRPPSDTTQVDLSAGQVLLLCSDGISVVPVDDFRIIGDETLEAYVRRLTDRAIALGSDDNISLLALRCD